MAVNGVQSIDEQRDRDAKKCLTFSVEGVDSRSFFDTSLFFQLVRRPGLKRGHLQKLCKGLEEGGPARVYSKALVEENEGEPVRGRIESRGVGLVYPVGGKPGARTRDRALQPARKRREQVR